MYPVMCCIANQVILSDWQAALISLDGQLEAVALMATPANHPLAREHLETARVLYPDDAILKQALARLLAASPSRGRGNPPARSTSRSSTPRCR